MRREVTLHNIVCQLAKLISLVVLMMLCGDRSLANTFNPTELDSIDTKVLKMVLDKAKAEEDMESQLRVYKAAIYANLIPSKFGLVATIIFGRSGVFSIISTSGKPIAKFSKFTDDFDFTVFTPQQLSHLDYLRGKSLAFAGYMNEAESILLGILNRDGSEVSLYTTTSCHYMAAYCSYYTEQLERSAKHATRAGQGFMAMGDRGRALEAFDGVSTTYCKMGAIDSAIHYARMALALDDSPGSIGAVNVYLNYAEALGQNNQIDSAFYFAELGSKYAKEYNTNPLMARAALCLAYLYESQGNTLAAIDKYELAITYFVRANEAHNLADAYNRLGILYASVGSYELAYGAGSKGFALTDSLRNDREKKDSDRLVAEYERDALNKQLKASEADRALAQAILAKRKLERVAWFLLLSSVLVLVGFFYYRSTVRRKLTQDLKRQVEERTTDLRSHSLRLELQAERLKMSNAELERFAYIASHDLKTPIRNVTSFLDLIKRRLPPKSRALVADYLEIASDNARQMHTLVTDVLEFSKLNANLSELSIEVSVAEVTEAVKKGMAADIQDRAASVSCIGDMRLVLPKGSLEQILSNLIGNGLKYNKAHRPEVKVLTIDMGDRVRITVSDNGIGIDRAYHERIFEVFRRLHTSDEYNGTGVGLAACRKVVLRLGGEISVDSREGEGSIFVVDLPKDLKKSFGVHAGSRQLATA